MCQGSGSCIVIIVVPMAPNIGYASPLRSLIDVGHPIGVTSFITACIDVKKLLEPMRLLHRLRSQREGGFSFPLQDSTLTRVTENRVVAQATSLSHSRDHGLNAIVISRAMNAKTSKRELWCRKLKHLLGAVSIVLYIRPHKPARINLYQQ